MQVLFRTTTFCLFCATLLGGCTTTSASLKPPVDALVAAAGASQATLQTYDQVLDAAILQASTNAALTGQGAVIAQPGDCGLTSAHCRIVLRRPDGQMLPLDSQPTDPVARQIMAGIVTYAANLQTIVAIDTQTGVQNAASAMAASVQQLATDIDGATKSTGNPTSMAATVTSYATPVTDATVFLAGNYLEFKKLAAIREAVTKMNAIFPQLMQICEASADAGSNFTRQDLLNAYQAAVTSYAINPHSNDALNALRAAAKAYDDFLSGNPVMAFEALAKAHAALADALAHPNPDFTTALAALQNALQSAQKAQAIINEFKTAAHPAGN